MPGPLSALMAGSGPTSTAMHNGGDAALGDDRHFRVDSDVRAIVVSDHNVWMAHHDGDVSIRKTRTTEVVHTLRPLVGRVWSMVVVPFADGNDRIWMGLSDGSVEVYDSVSYTKLHHLMRHTGGVYAMTEYGGYVFSGSNDFTVVVWSTERYRAVKQLCGHTSYVRCLYAEGSIVVSGSDDHTLRVWQVPSGALLHTHHIHHSGVSAVCRVGMHIWSGDDLGQLCVWALGTYELLLKNDQAHASRITAIKKVGSRVYIGSTDRKVSIWDAYGKRPLRVMEDHGSWITCLACPAVLSRYYVWSAGADGAVRCWHHDEYRVMNGDAERFDDVRWYYTMHPPSTEQATALMDHLHAQDTQLTHWKEEADARRGDTSRLTVEVEALRSKAQLLEGEKAALQERAEAAEALLRTKETVLAAKETELKELSAKSIALTQEAGRSKLATETSTSSLAEAQRRMEQAVAEKAAAEALLVKVRDLKLTEGHGMPILVLNTSDDVGASTLALHSDVRSLMQLNEFLRDEVERYKGVLGIKSKTPYPILKITALAEDKAGAPLVVVPAPPSPATPAEANGLSSASPPPGTAAVTPTAASSSGKTILRRVSSVVGAPPSSSAPPPASPSTAAAATTPPVSSPPVASTTSPTTTTSPPVASTSGTAPTATGATSAKTPTPTSVSSIGAAQPAASAAAPAPTPAPPTATALATDARSLPQPLVPTRPAASTNNAGGAPASTTSVGTATVATVVPSVPLFSVDASGSSANTYEVLHGGARWLNPNVSSYVQERYHRKVTPLFGPAADAGPMGTPRSRDVSPRSVSPRCHGQSTVRPATARAFGSATTRKYF